ncbi:MULTISPECIES: Ig-like domain-containing protein [unclassified Roseobacter]|nr:MULTISPECIES: Ig-like domain-containing protein [unclassified Roseobacter]NNV25314.1 hypothetical protein [Roseobacter sp. HKCCD8192]NNV29571.1 hypothetical protein [Roseobacter sp. HKCCD9061]NNV33844.1 hypothetical protein [Roseobacter sp. HKCCD9073]NNV42051.1 hypothetical protein [Roseobacter sp. HKCCD6497]NNV59373.1 hypothetical protein [Roseobacter sp. HKCCD8861]NNV75189.1 hypothetical protein [Roseobacter sp. HKCCD6135]NNW14726.1 hypothetical protein [Roseobacter sp. HKCCD8832]NNW23
MFRIQPRADISDVSLDCATSFGTSTAPPFYLASYRADVDGLPNACTLRYVADVTAVTVEFTATVTTDGSTKTASLDVTSVREGSSADTDAPTITSLTRIRPTTELTGAVPELVWQIAFDEDVQNVDVSDFVATGGEGSLGLRRLTDRQYEITFQGAALMSGNGAVKLSLVPGQDITDLVGNALTETAPTGANEPSFILDTARPSPTISSSASAATNLAVIPLTIQFSEAVTELTVGDFIVSGGAISGFSGTEADYSANLTPSGDGVITVDLPSAAALDQVGQPSLAAETFTITSDRRAPRVASIERRTPSDALSNADSLTWRVVFDEPVTGVSAEDFTLSGTSADLSVAAIDSTQYDVTASGGLLASFEGTVSLAVTGSAAIQDLATNSISDPQPVGTNESYMLDNIAPAISLSSTTPDPFAEGDLTLVMQSDEVIPGFGSGALQITNGTLTSQSQPNARTLNIVITPTDPGPVTVRLPAGAFGDAAGNTTGEATLSREYGPDVTAPRLVSVTRLQPATTPSNADTLNWRLAFDEPVMGFDASDLSIAGAVPGTGTVVVSPITDMLYDVVVSGGDIPSLSGTVTLGFAVVQNITDLAGNALANLITSSSPDTREALLDNTAPGVTLSSGAASPSNAASFPLMIVFDEPVSGFGDGDVSVTGGTISAISGSGATYSATLTPSADGMVTAMVNAAVAVDAAGNGNLAATALSILSDRTVPDVAISGLSALITEAVPLTVRFSEDVTGFVEADIAVENATLSGFAGSGRAYSVTLTPDSDGAVSVQVPASRAEDAAGNGNQESGTIAATADLSPPGVSITGLPALLNGAATITVTFDEPVSGFDIADLVLSNASASDLSGAGAVYQVLLTPLADGPVTVGVRADAAQDRAGRFNTVSNTATATADLSAPSVMITGVPPDLAGPTLVTIRFSAPVTGFTVADLTLSNAQISMFSGNGAEYQFTLTPEADGPVSLLLPANAAIDAAGNGNTAPNPISALADMSGPTVSVSALPPMITGSTSVNLTFSEPVFGLELSDFETVNAQLSALTGTGSSYTLQITPDADGAVSLRLPAGRLNDAAGNPNLASDWVGSVADISPPTVTLSPLPSVLGAPVQVSITFSEAVSGLEVADFTTLNAMVSNLSGGGAGYQVTLIPSGDGPVEMQLPSGRVFDAAGHANVASLAINSVADMTDPTVNITPSVTTVAGAQPITIAFGEPVIGFTLADIVVANATLTNFSGNEAVYTVTLTPESNGPIFVSIPEGVVTDGVGRPNQASDLWTSLGVVPKPTVSITGLPNPILGPALVQIRFSEPVTGFELGDIQSSNAALSDFSGSGADYAVRVTPQNEGAVSLGIPEDVAVATSGAGNEAFVMPSVLADLTPPTVSLSGTPAPVGVAYMIAVVFSEPVTGLDLSDFVTVGATVTQLTGSGAVYQMQLTATQMAHSVRLPENATQDAAGRGNRASTAFEIVPDGHPPSLQINGMPSSLRAGEPVTLRFDFSEPVVGFSSNDINLINAVMLGMSGGPQHYSVEIAPTGEGPLSLNVAGGAAHDASGQGSMPARLAAMVVIDTTHSDEISDFLQARSRDLIAGQPGLTEFLRGRQSGQVIADVSRGQASLDLQTNGGGPVWMSFQASRSEDDSGQDATYALAVFGSHLELGPTAILGAMLQFDHAQMIGNGGVEIEGDGWLLGPYFAAHLPGQPLYFEGRLLRGQVKNTLAPAGGVPEQFEGTRWLATLAVSGAHHGENLSTYPSLTFSRVHDRQDAYSNSAGALVPAQRIALSELSLGVDFEMPFALDAGDLTITWGVSGIMSQIHGGGEASAFVTEEETVRGRLDLGYMLDNGRGLTSNARAFMDGIGSRSGLVSYGVEAGFQLEF